jgi:hypothetical protein
MFSHGGGGTIVTCKCCILLHDIFNLVSCNYLYSPLLVFAVCVPFPYQMVRQSHTGANTLLQPKCTPTHVLCNSSASGAALASPAAAAAAAAAADAAAASAAASLQSSTCTLLNTELCCLCALNQ